MKNPTLAQTGGLSGSIGDDLRQLSGLDGDKVQQAFNNPNHPFRQEVVALALKHFSVVTWRKEGGIIFVTLTSNGMTSPEWKAHFEKKGIQLSPNALKILDHWSFKASRAGTIRHIGVLPGEMFSDGGRVTRTIRAKAASLRLQTLDIESECLIRDAFSKEEINAMGLNWIVGMHQPVEIGGDLDLLTADANDAVPKLNTYYDSPGLRWNRGSGFAFGASQVLKT
jgi:hypothetical protein